MIMKLTQFFESRRLSDQILFELNDHMIIIEIKGKKKSSNEVNDKLVRARRNR